MKKALLILAAVMVTGMTFTSCSSTKSCPAYGKVVKPAAERPA